MQRKIVSCTLILLLALTLLHTFTGTLEAEEKQVGAFSVRENAEKTLMQLQSQGRHAFIRQKKVKGRNFYTVIVDDSVKPEPVSRPVPAHVETPATPEPVLVEISSQDGSMTLMLYDSTGVYAYRYIDGKKSFGLMETYADYSPAILIKNFSNEHWYRIEPAKMANKEKGYIKKSDVIDVKESVTPIAMRAEPLGDGPEAWQAQEEQAAAEQETAEEAAPSREGHKMLGAGLHTDAINLSAGPIFSYRPIESIALQVHYGLGTYTTYGTRALYIFDLFDFADPYVGAGYTHSSVEVDSSGIKEDLEAEGFTAYFGMEKQIIEGLHLYVEASATTLEYEDETVTSGASSYKLSTDHSPYTVGAGLVYYFY